MKYSQLVELYESLSQTTKRLGKTYLIAEFLKKVPLDDLPAVILMLQGRVFPIGSDKNIGMSTQLVMRALSIATGLTLDSIQTQWKKIGDLGIVAEKSIKKKTQSTLFSNSLTISKVFSNLRKLPEISGAGSVDTKVKLISELFTSATPVEAKYILRAVVEDLRVGVGDGTLRDALCWAYVMASVPYNPQQNELTLDDAARKDYQHLLDQVQEGYDLTADFSEVAVKLKEKGLAGLKRISLQVGRPVKIMLYQKALSIANAFERVGKPCQFEYKYDGFLVIIHKKKDKLWIYTRRQEDITAQFPDVVEIIRLGVTAENCILNAEVVGYDPLTKKFRPFQEISQRIKRKYDIEELIKKLPCQVFVFDCIYLNGETLLNTPFSQRREQIIRHVKIIDNKIRPAHALLTESETEAQKFYDEAIAKGLEGVMAKKLDAIYKPGSRVGYGVKVKPVMDTLDLVVIGAEWGEGKRAGWLTSFIVACRNDEGDLLEVGRVGTGIKEKPEEGFSFSEFTDLLKPLKIKEEGKVMWVQPQVVISIKCEEIQKSPSYSSGYALRFPRFAGLRPDKPLEEITSLEEIEELYLTQRGRG